MFVCKTFNLYPNEKLMFPFPHQQETVRGRRRQLDLGDLQRTINAFGSGLHSLLVSCCCYRLHVVSSLDEP
eukprot:COSAG01_NODE_65839_length_272_cov_0.595376_1_plen_70_part_10